MKKITKEVFVDDEGREFNSLQAAKVAHTYDRVKELFPDGSISYPGRLTYTSLEDSVCNRSISEIEILIDYLRALVDLKGYNSLMSPEEAE